MKNKLIVINSIGPMGSSVLSALLEHYGILNFPIRKRGLSLDIHNLRELGNQDLINITSNLIKYEEEGQIGGVSVLKRKEIKKNKKFKYSSKITEKFLDKKYDNIEDMYFASMDLLNESVSYKKSIKKIVGSIELAIDSYKYDMPNLEKNYEKHFSNVYFISCIRDFENWINTLCAVRFVKKKLFLKYLKFNIFKWKKTYKKYYNNINKSKGLIINFDDIFLPNTNKTMIKVENYLGLTNLSFEKLKIKEFDLFGHIISFDDALTKYDDNKTVLSKSSLKFLRYYSNLKFNIVTDSFFTLIFLLMYIKDFIKFRINKKDLLH